MAYNDFTLEKAEKTLGVATEPVELFAALAPVSVPGWLQETLNHGMELALMSEKARSEFIVGPILLASRVLSHNAVTIYSGQRLDVKPEQGLIGECDFILAASPSVRLLRAPLVTIVEAKRHDIDAGLGQCVAQMVAARLFNEQEGHPVPRVFGCVTTGETWQFLRLEGAVVGIDRKRYYIDDVGRVLAVWQAVIAQFQPTVSSDPHRAATT
jgi:hypothetical protein